MEKTQGFLSTDKLDIGYVLLGITQDGPSLVPSPDYKISTETLLISITRAFVKRTLHLSIIMMRGRNRHNGDNLPSWCPDWLGAFDSTAKYEKTYIYSSLSRDNTDVDHLLVSDLSKTEEGYRWKAGGRLLEHWDETINANPMLQVKGYFFDYVEGLSTEYHHASNGSQSDDDFPYAHQLWQPRKTTGNPYRTGLRSRLLSIRQSVPNVVVRTLLYKYHYPEGQSENGVASAFRVISGFSDHWSGKLFGMRLKPSNASRWLVENRYLNIHGKPLGTWFGQPPLLVLDDIQITGLFCIISLFFFWAACIVLYFLGHQNWVSALGAGSMGSAAGIFLIPFPGLTSRFVMQMWTLYKNTDKVLEDIAKKLEETRMRLIITQTGYIGLGHAQSRQGDSIFVIKGCTMPVIMRSYQDGFKAVGMAFVEGIMEGELLERPNQEPQELKLY